MRSLGLRPSWLLPALVASAKMSTPPPLPHDSNDYKDLPRDCNSPSLYCSPLANEYWHINRPHTVRWYSRHPSVAGNNNPLSISLFVSDNSTEPILIRTNVSNSNGNYLINVTKKELYRFDDAPRFSSNGTYLPKKAWFTVLPFTNPADTVAPPVYFNLVDPDAYSHLKPTPTEIDSSAPSNPSSPHESETDVAANEPNDRSIGRGMGSREKFPIYGIVLLVLTLSAVLGMLLFLLLFWRRRRHKLCLPQKSSIEKGKLNGDAPEQDSDLTIAPDLDATQRLHTTGSALPCTPRDITPTNGSTVAKKTNLSANDALMLSETFRELLRKPSWSDEHPNNPIDELLDRDQTTSTRLEEELALDGVGIHDLESKRNLTIIQGSPESPPTHPSNL
ncbi:hypothetical protein L0F63_001579 [Massospora cicadina]|nr:hypothetical protein L0F63_001579 [Massospora cicadina]